METMEILRKIFNHSDTGQTKNYIGLSKEKVDRYYDDFSEALEEFVIGGKEENCK